MISSIKPLYFHSDAYFLSLFFLFSSGQLDSIVKYQPATKMAAPATKTLKNISGNWILNQKTSDSFEPMLVIQGVSWWKRQVSNH